MMWRSLRRFLVIGALIGTGMLGACAPQEMPVGVAGPEGVLENKPYTLASGDRIKVTVFQHEDLSGEFQLDGNGRYAMPLIGEVDAYGLTTRELEQRVRERFADGYLVDPQVSVEVLNYRPFFILGEVARPGQYEYQAGMTVIQAVTIAGGFSYRANQAGVTIKRGGSGAKGVRVGADTQVLPGDVIEVPERFF